MSSSLSLNGIAPTATSAVQAAQNVLNSLIPSIVNGGNVTNADLLGFQLALAQADMTVSINSAIIKDLKDTEQGVVQKF